MTDIERRAKELFDQAIKGGSKPELRGPWIMWGPPPESVALSFALLEFQKSEEADAAMRKLIQGYNSEVDDGNR